MSEQVVLKRKTIPFWKASVILIVWLSLLLSTGMYFGNRYFWTGIDVRQIEREIAYYRQLAETEPEQPEHRVALAFNMYRLKDYQGALLQLQTAIDLDNNYYDAYLNRGYIYTDLGYWDDALAAFEKCVELSPEDYKGHFNLGIVYRELEMFEAAFDQFNIALELRPAATDVMYHQALTAQRAGNNDIAIEFLHNALSLDPNYKDAIDLLKQLQ